MSLFKVIAVAVAFVCSIRVAEAQRPEIWFAGSPFAADFNQVADRPDLWATAATNIVAFSVPSTFVMRGKSDDVKKLLLVLRAKNLPLAVGLPIVTTDKHVCGDGVEGMIWPGEAGLVARRLKDLGADVGFFSFDLPLTAGHIMKKPSACRFSIRETAQRVVRSVRELRAAYPNARFNDAEVPTGMPASQWIPILTEWLDAFTQATGERLYGFGMDVWWESPWMDTMKQSIGVLHAHGVRAGTFVDADAGNVPPADWIAAAKRNACLVRSLNPSVDFVAVANWLNRGVRDLPESDPSTLTALVNWYAAGPRC